ncbi:MAG: methylated-DNA--[protein]-cysteine S-methyltransferase [Burkholderiales bacterium]|nr:methylated-DNA--[protein]-cysteine S-methyltransferase [Burkholderiales bacterium]
MIYYLNHHSALGEIKIASSEKGLCSVRFPDHAHWQTEREQGWQERRDHAILQRAVQQLDEYLAGQRQHFELPLDAGGTPFQQRVWQALLSIPYGQTSNYGALAQQIGQPKAARPLGAANGRNPLSIIVPCHRVIGSNGDLVGYAGGLERKRFLLALENRQARLDGIDVVAA